MRIVEELADYSTGRDVSEALASAESVMGRRSLQILSNQLLGLLRIAIDRELSELEEGSAWKAKVETLLRCCPRLSEIFTIQGSRLVVPDAVSESQLGEIEAMLRTRLPRSILTVYVPRDDGPATEPPDTSSR